MAKEDRKKASTGTSTTTTAPTPAPAPAPAPALIPGASPAIPPLNSSSSLSKLPANSLASRANLRKVVSYNNVDTLSAPASSPGSAAAASTAHTARWSHVGYHRTTIPPEATFDESHDQIKRDLLGMIVQYLQQEGLRLSSATIQDEANVKLAEKSQEKEAFRRMSRAIIEGDWDLVAKMINKHFRRFHAQQGFLYAVCKQEYLELIDRQESQKAFTFLTTHLKPLERISTMTNRNEFKDLCYLLTCKSVTEVDAFRDWEGVVRSREKLVEQLRTTFELDEWILASSNSGASSHPNAGGNGKMGDDCVMQVPENRLMQLLHQSVAYQMEFSRYHPKTVPKVTTLLRDFECEVLPNAVKSTYVGHKQNVKFATFVGQDGEFLASGSSDTTIKLWPVEFPSAVGSQDEPCPTPMGQLCSTWHRDLCGHSSRIWYLCSNSVGDRLYSASGDGTVKIWDVREALADLSAQCHGTQEDMNQGLSSLQDSGNGTAETTGARASDCIATLQNPGHGDIYSVNLHPSETHLVTGGYDQTVRLYDIQTGALTKTFRGHSASVCDAQFNRHANLIVSGSKDGTIRMWDILSGLCVHTLRQTLGEVTSISLASNGFTLLTGSRNNSNRLWDLRMLNTPRTQLSVHTSSSHSNLAAMNASGTSGSQSSLGRSSSQVEPRPIQRFKGHQNTAKNVVRASFGPREAFVLGGSEDGAVYVWDVATGKLLEKLVGHHGVTYNAKWHEKQALMVSSSQDSTVKTWWWEDKER